MAGSGDYNREFVITLKTEFKNNTDAGLKRAKKDFQDFSNTAKSAQENVSALDKSKASPSITAVDRATDVIEEAKKDLYSFQMQDAEATLGVDEDPFNLGIAKAKGAADSFSSLNPSVTIGAKDNASTTIAGAVAQVESATSRTWDITLGVIDKVTSPLKKTYDWLTSIQGLVTTIFAGQAWQSIVGAPVQTADFYTTANIGFETMFTSENGGDVDAAAAQAQEYMDRIKKFAVTTPFNTSGLVEMAQSMLAMGFAADEIIPKEDALSGILGKVGNAMAAMGKGEEGVQSVTLALSQMNAAGKVSAQDMMQLTNAGIPAWKYLAQAMGLSVQEVRDLSQQGEITAETGIKAMLDGMSQFDGMMEKTANETVSGLLSQLEDVFEMGVKQPWGEGLAQGIKPGIEAFSNFFSTITQEGSNARNAISEIATGIGQYFGNTLTSISEKWNSIFNNAEFNAADAKGKVAIFLNEGVLEPLSVWWRETGQPFVVDTIRGGLNLVGEIIKENFGSILTIAFSNPITAIKALQTGMSGLQSVMSGFSTVKSLVDKFNNLRNGVKGVSDVTSTLIGTADEVAGTLGNLSGTASTAASTTDLLRGAFRKTFEETGSLTEAFRSVQAPTSMAAEGIEGIASAASGAAPAIEGVSAAAGTAESGFLSASTAVGGLSTSLLGIGAAAVGAGAVAYTLYQQWKQTSDLITDVVEKNNEARANLDTATGNYNTFNTDQAAEAEKLSSGSGDITGLEDRLFTLSANFDGSQAQAGEMQLLTDLINQKNPELELSFNVETGELSSAREELDEIVNSTKLADTKSMASEFFEEIIDKAPEFESAVKTSTDAIQSLYDKRKELSDSGVYGTNKAFTQIDEQIAEQTDSYNAALDQIAASDLTARASMIVSAPDFTGSWQQAMDEARKQLTDEGYVVGQDLVIHMSEGLKAEKGYLVTSVDGTLSEAAQMPPGTITKFYEIGSHASNTYVNGWIDEEGNLRDATSGAIINAAHYQMDTGNSIWYETAENGITQYKKGWIDDQGNIVDATTGQIQAGINEASLRMPQMFQIGTAGQEQYVLGFNQNGHIVSATGEVLDQAVANAQAYQMSYFTVGTGSGGELVHGFVDGSGNLHDETGRIIADSTQVITDRGPDYAAAAQSVANDFKSSFQQAWESFTSWWDGVWNSFWSSVQQGTNEAVNAHNQAMGYNTANVQANANGNIISSPTLSLVGEAGPEAIIPLSSSKRERGMKLWQAAGQQLGVRQFADGGVVGGSTGSAQDSAAPAQEGVEVNVSITGDANFNQVAEQEEMLRTQLVGITAQIQSDVGTGFTQLPLVAEAQLGGLNGVVAGNLNATAGNFTNFNTQIANAATTGFGEFNANVGSGLNTFNSSVSSGITSAAGTVSTGLSQMAQNTTAGMSTMAQAATEGMYSFNTSFSTGFATVVTTVSSGMGRVITTIQSYKPQINLAGQELMNEFNAGVQSKASQVVDSTNELVNKIKQAFITGLGIHSPSKETYYYGEMMAQGIIEGFSDSDLQKFVESTVGEMKTSFEGGKFNANELVAYIGDDTPKLIDYLNATGDQTTGKAQAADDGMIAFPLLGTRGTQSSWFGNRPSPGGIGSTNHKGVDLATDTGTPILSALPGVVTTAGWYGGYGNAVVVDSGNGLTIVYGHMSAIGTTVGAQVGKGQQIGLVGSTGNSTGPHLHFEMRQNGEPFDPQPYVDGAASVAGLAAPNTLAGVIQQAYNLSKGIVTAGSTAMANVPYDISAGAQQWTPQVLQALQMLGQPESLLNYVLYAIDCESSGNPNSRNDWDSNAAIGQNSAGLLQTIPATFESYRNPNLSANIYDPLANIYAGLNYMIQRYGSIEAVVEPRLDKWEGYAKGTDNATKGLHWVGEKGPELMMFSGGEQVIPHDQSVALARNAENFGQSGFPAMEPTPTSRDTQDSYKSNIQDPLSDVLNDLNHQLQIRGSIGAPLDGYESGTTSATPGVHWVGEEGPELLNYNDNGPVVPHEQSMAIASTLENAPEIADFKFNDYNPDLISNEPRDNGFMPIPSGDQNANNNTNNSNYSIDLGGVTVNITVNANDNQNAPAQIIEASQEIADKIAGQIAAGLRNVSEGTPVKGNVLK